MCVNLEENITYQSQRQGAAERVSGPGSVLMPVACRSHRLTAEGSPAHTAASNSSLGQSHCPRTDADFYPVSRGLAAHSGDARTTRCSVDSAVFKMS